MTELRTFVQLVDEDDTVDELDEFGNPKKKTPPDDDTEDTVTDGDKLDEEDEEDDEDAEVVAKHK